MFSLYKEKEKQIKIECKPSRFDQFYQYDLIQVPLLIQQVHFDRFQMNFQHLKK